MLETGKLDDLMPSIIAEFDKGNCIRLYPRGVSMLPMLDGKADSVILSPNIFPIKKYDVLLYKRPNGQYILHRIVCVRNKDFDCCGDNQLYVEKGVRNEWGIAKVIAFTRKKRLLTVNQFCYILYSRAIVWCRPLRLLVHKVKRKLFND